MAAVAIHVYGHGVRKFKISTIIDYLGYVPNRTELDYTYAVKSIDKAENALSSNHLRGFSFGGSPGWYRADVLASMKPEIRKVEVCFFFRSVSM